MIQVLIAKLLSAVIVLWAYRVLQRIPQAIKDASPLVATEHVTHHFKGVKKPKTPLQLLKFWWSNLRKPETRRIVAGWMIWGGLLLTIVNHLYLLSYATQLIIAWPMKLGTLAIVGGIDIGITAFVKKDR